MFLNLNAMQSGSAPSGLIFWTWPARGEFSTDILAEHKRRLSAYVSFQFDRTLPSGRVVATYARPTREADMS
jgi:hypothetical protein